MIPPMIFIIRFYFLDLDSFKPLVLFFLQFVEKDYFILLIERHVALVRIRATSW